MKEVDKLKQHNEIPAHLQQYQKGRIGNVDSTDRIIPRIKLLQAISPELQDYGTAKAGMFWHTVMQESLGPSFIGIPILIRKSYVLWAPRNDDRGILSRAMDGVHWDQPNCEFSVKPKGASSSITYNTRETVQDSGLDQFGSSIPGDPNSPPAASLTYNMMWYLPEFPDLSPSVVINTRSSVKPMQQLLSRIDAKSVAHYVQMYEVGVTQQKGSEGPYFNYTYSGAGFAEPDLAKVCADLFDRFSKGGWVANDESEEDHVTGTRSFDQNTASKF